jgi:hypothetical protein
MKMISDWKPQHASLFGKHTLALHHRLNETGLFTKSALAELIDRYPATSYNLHTMGIDPTNPDWRRGMIGDLPGSDVIRAIENGRMWLNLRNAQNVDERYKRVLSDIFAEFEDRVPGLKTFKQDLGILISSPSAQVFYHADVPGQSLWQLAGRKRIYIYPNSAPFLKPEGIEGIVIGETQEEVHYEPWFDDYAEVHDLEPGQMLHWALNGPHRVINEDCLNISVTTEHFTPSIRKAYAVNYANGVMRRYFGMKPGSQSTEGLSVYPKAALALIWKQLNLSKSRKFVPVLNFRPDPNAPLGIVDMPQTQK